MVEARRVVTKVIAGVRNQREEEDNKKMSSSGSRSFNIY